MQDLVDVDSVAPVLCDDGASLRKICCSSAPKMSDGMKAAMKPIQHPECPTLTHEPEEAPHINPSYEKFKSLAAALSVLAFWASLICILSTYKANFNQPKCSAKALNGEPIYQRDLLRSCEICGYETICQLPWFGEWEKTWPTPIRIILYFVGIVWAFLGIGLVCDQFSAAIEEITSAERVVWLEVKNGYKHKFHVRVWNGTVANLTLMALGSSAPEILLSIIEIVGNDFYSGSLGPSTIVGSAAFNLLMITSVCVSAIPAPESRKIASTDVYMVTASLSLFAYFWLIVVLKWVTPDKVDIMEAIMTFLLFPFLIITALMADKGWFQAEQQQGHKMLAIQRSRYWIEQETHRLQLRFGKELSAEALRIMLLSLDGKTKAPVKSRAQYHRSIMCRLSSGRKTKSFEKGSAVVSLGFETAEHVVLECVGKLSVKIVASRAPGVTVELYYFTKEASAKSGVRYKDVAGTVRFAPNQTEHYIEVPIIDNDIWEPDEHFFIHLTDLQVVAGRFMSSVHHSDTILEHQMGINLTRVTVVNDDVPGTLEFDLPEVFTREGADATVGISRSNGTSGKITCKYATKGASAVKGVDYTHIEGTLMFEHGEGHKTITIPIHAQKANRFSDDRFQIELAEPSSGVLFNKDTDGGADFARCEVVISKTVESKSMLSCAFMNQSKVRNSCREWRENCEVVWYCNGGISEQAQACPKDWIMHCLCLVWKVLFATVPPASLLGGWPCFVLSLAWIGAVTAFVGDLASLLGCSLDLKDDITAITLVALGTSLPDTLASKTAAEEDPTADNSIGNVTGSNCVNVFLGLGLPWLIAALVWNYRGPTAEWKGHTCHGCQGNPKPKFADEFAHYKDGGFIVPASSLSFSVTVYTMCALVCILLLFARRRMYGGELGGPQHAQYRDSAILACLWLVYIAASIAQSISTASS